jgi:hypothetical protein
MAAFLLFLGGKKPQRSRKEVAKFMTQTFCVLPKRLVQIPQRCRKRTASKFLPYHCLRQVCGIVAEFGRVFLSLSAM